MITLTEDQEKACQFAVTRLLEGEQLTTIGGWAGTGKTTIMSEIVRRLREKRPDAVFSFACYTGKAKGVLETKLKAEAMIEPKDFCGTLHSLLYRPIQNREVDEETNHIEINYDFARNDSENHTDFIIIDEASMVTRGIFEDVLKLEKPILAVGDHGQLPPVASNFNLMDNPMIRLEKIHRQAADNPIIQLATLARTGQQIPFQDFSKNGFTVMKTSDGSIVSRTPNIQEWMIICGTNKKRARLNNYVRERLMTIPPEIPQFGEKVICLRNNHAKKIFNGMLGKILRAEIHQDHWLWVEINMGDFIFSGKIFRYQFGYQKTCNATMYQCPDVDPDDFMDLFDFGYCLTAHKAQGSESESVIVYEESAMRHMQEKLYGPEGWRRWLYTALTRARKELIIIGE